MPRRHTRFPLLVALLVLSPVCLASDRDDPAPSAEEVLQRVVASYGSMTSYRDRGVSMTRSASGDGAPERRIAFETLFRRPGKLRFAWDVETIDRPRKTHSVIWSDETSAWSSLAHAGNTPEREESLARAVCGATGISAGAAQIIPKLLTAEVGGLRIDGLEDYGVTGEESIEGVACVQLTAYYHSGTRFTVWIGRDDHLIRKIVTDHGGTEHVEIRTDIIVDGDVSDSDFKE